MSFGLVILARCLAQQSHGADAVDVPESHRLPSISFEELLV